VQKPPGTMATISSCVLRLPRRSGLHPFREQIQNGLRGRWAHEIEALTARGNIEHELLDARDAQEAPA
jgi:hypothetical protein